jgi:predicted ArsR family transcriptional regulator
MGGRHGTASLEIDDKDERFVATLTKYGVSAADIARELDVDQKTLQRHFGEVIADAAARREAAEINALWKRAKAGSARALITLHRRMIRAEREQEN